MFVVDQNDNDASVIKMDGMHSTSTSKELLAHHTSGPVWKPD